MQTTADGSQGPDTKAAEKAPEVPLPEFDPRCAEALDGLIYLGALTDTLRWCGHTFVIRTLNSDEYLAVGLLHKEYLGSLGVDKAYQAAMAAACLISVDGRPLAAPLAPDDDLLNILRPRFKQVVQWFPATLDAVHTFLLELENQVDEVLEAMGKALG